MNKKNIDNEPGLFGLVREEQFNIQTKLKVMHESFEGVVRLLTRIEAQVKEFDTRVTFLELATNPSKKKGLLNDHTNGNGDSKVLP